MNNFKLTFKPPYLYSYSRFGTAAAGACLSQVYDVDFYSILTIFASEELGLKHTFVSLDNSVENGWVWKGIRADSHVKHQGVHIDHAVNTPAVIDPGAPVGIIERCTGPGNHPVTGY